jgi:hypothetical protein
MMNARQQRAWCHVGDVLVPGHAPLPKYSETRAVELIPRLLAAGHPDDASAISLVVQCLRVVPKPLLAMLLHLVAAASRLRGAPGGPFRLLELGLRGVVLSSYYAGLDVADGESRIHGHLGYHISCHTGKDTSA